MLLERIYDDDLAQGAWLIGCQATREAIIIDPQRDISRYVDALKKAGLNLIAVAETHIHADFLSGVGELARATDAMCYLSNCGGPDWLYAWPSASNLDVTFVSEGDTIKVGNVTLKVLHTPGHTPEHICFLVFDAGRSEPVGLVSGDFIFVGDLGRPDLLETAAGVDGVMEESASVLFHTCEKLKSLPSYIQIWPGHGAGSACGKALGAVSQSTLGYEQQTSPPLQLLNDKQAFVDFMLEGQPEPPLYFARMKRMNRDGIPILGNLPTPIRIEDAEKLREQALECTVIDTRNWEDVRDGHLKGTIWSKATGDFHRFAGSFVDEDEEIIFITTQENLDRAIRNAIRIGLDRIVGWADPSLLEEMDGLETMPEITAQELIARNEKDILDVRRMPEYERGNIPEACNIAHTRLMDRLDDLNSEKEWVVHCLGGGRSAAACMALKRRGYNVTNLAGGYSGWVAAKNTCTTSI